MVDIIAENKKQSSWKEYLESEEWKCPDAKATQENPRGAHHWIGVAERSNVFRCKYCGMERGFSTGYNNIYGSERENF